MERFQGPPSWKTGSSFKDFTRSLLQIKAGFYKHHPGWKSFHRGLVGLCLGNDPPAPSPACRPPLFSLPKPVPADRVRPGIAHSQIETPTTVGECPRAPGPGQYSSARRLISSTSEVRTVNRCPGLPWTEGVPGALTWKHPRQTGPTLT